MGLSRACRHCHKCNLDYFVCSAVPVLPKTHSSCHNPSKGETHGSWYASIACPTFWTLCPCPLINLYCPGKKVMSLFTHAMFELSNAAILCQEAGDFDWLKISFHSRHRVQEDQKISSPFHSSDSCPWVSSEYRFQGSQCISNFSYILSIKMAWHLRIS